MSRIITFYSYKGGVGRTLALANIGVLLAKLGKRVLLMDWDLEAPGLDRYFQPYVDGGFAPSNGVVHLLHDTLNNSGSDWRSHVQEISVKAKNVSPEKSYALSVIPSGVASSDYGSKVRTFSWNSFIEEKDGGPILERWREEWKQEFDFVLVDSRTGITDTGGICTILLPDLLVLVFTANDQSFEGAVRISQSAQVERRNLAVQRAPLAILPLLSRFDGRKETDLAEHWMKRFNTDLKPFFDDWLPKQFEPRQIIELTKIPYVTRFSFGEPLPVLTHSLTDPEFPGFYLENATRLLVSDFKDAARIIDPASTHTDDTSSQIRALISRVPLEEIELTRLLRIAEKELGESPELSELLNDISIALYKQARWQAAEPLMRRALILDERNFGPEHPTVAIRLSNLGELLRETNRLTEAEPLMRQALAIDEKSYGPDHPSLAIDLNNLAQLLQETNRLSEAESLMRRALAIDEQRYGPEHSAIVIHLNNLAQLLQQTNRLGEAEPLMRRALAITEESYGPEHPTVATTLNNLAALLQDTNRLAEAEPLMRRALTIDEGGYGPEHPTVAIRLNNLAQLLKETNRMAEAEPLMRRALVITEQSYGPGHPIVATNLNNLALLLQDTNRLDEAEPLMRRALAIDERSYGPQHPTVAVDLNNLALLLQDTNRLEEAERLMRRALAIDEQSYGPEHPSVAIRLTSLASLLRDTNRLAEAQLLMERALAIDEQSYGGEHPKVARRLNNLALLLRDSDRLSEAEPLARRALEIFKTFTDASALHHPRLRTAVRNYKVLLEEMGMKDTEIETRLNELGVLDESLEN